MTPRVALGAPDVVASLVIPRHVWSNTTVRQVIDGKAIGRYLVLVESEQDMTRVDYPSTRDYQTEVGRRMDPENPVNPAVVDKILLFAEHLGIGSRQKSAKSPRHYAVHNAGKALLTDPDPEGMLAFLLLQQTMDDSPIRYNLEILRFLRDCHALGIHAVRVDQLSFFMATKLKSGSWRKEALALQKYVPTHPTGEVTSERWVRLIDKDGHARSAIEEAVEELVSSECLTDDDVVTQVRRLSHRLLPRARGTALLAYADKVAPAVLAGDYDSALEITWTDLLGKKISNNADMVGTALRYLADVRLLTRTAGPGKGGDQYRLTEFGEEALTQFPEKNPSFAASRRAQRASTTSPFGGRAQVRADRFAEIMAAERTLEGRTARAGTLDWRDYQGLHVAGAFELAVVRSILSKVTPHDDHDILSGIRTLTDHNFDALRHAPGGASDGWIHTKDGRHLLIEVTGVEGEDQIKQELGPVVRHLREFVLGHVEPALAIFVAPSVDLDLVAYLATAAKGSASDGTPPAFVLPLTTDQLARLLVAEPSFEEFVDAAMPLLVTNMHESSRDGARTLLEAIESLVQRTAA